jgi:hypothetical protein
MAAILHQQGRYASRSGGGEYHIPAKEVPAEVIWVGNELLDTSSGHF